MNYHEVYARTLALSAIGGRYVMYGFICCTWGPPAGLFESRLTLIQD